MTVWVTVSDCFRYWLAQFVLEMGHLTVVITELNKGNKGKGQCT